MKRTTIFFVTLIALAAMVINGCAPSPAPIASPEMPTLTLPTATAIPQTPVLRARTLQVASTADSGPGTLRQALLDAKVHDVITFDPTVFMPDAPATIALTSSLPELDQGNLTIDASNAGVILNGIQLDRDEWIPGLNIISDGNTIRGLQIINFTGTGIVMDLYSRNNTIGGDRNIGRGLIGQGNMISSNDTGIALWNSASDNIVMGNLVGTDISGVQPMGNHGWGIWVGTADNMIGPNNVIAFNGECGIDVEGLSNTITQNLVFENGDPGGICLLAGGNMQQVAPMIFDFDLSRGLVTGTACENCIIEIFSENGGEGVVYEGETVAGEDGVFSFDKGAPLTGPFLIASATDPQGNTSEFSLPTQGSNQELSLQHGNEQPMLQLQPLESNELADNRTGLSYGGIDPHLEELNNIIYELSNLGAKRIDTPLHELEPPIDWSMSEFEYESPDFDRFVYLLAENGITLNYIIHFWDKVGHIEGEELSTPRFQDDEQVQDYVDYVRLVVRHFKGRIPYYTIWSEPDYCGDGGIKCILPQDYITLVRQVIPVIREEDPQAKVVSAPYVLYFGREDLSTILHSDVVKWFDVISWHPLYDVFPNSEFYGNYYYEYPSIIREIKQTASDHGFAGEYWGTEITWRSEEYCFQDLDHEILETDLLAAKYYARAIIMQLGMDVVTGVISHPGHWSYPTIRNVNTVMAGNRPFDLEVEIESEARNLMSFGFSLPNGDRLFALWTNGVAVEYDPGMRTTLTFHDISAKRVIGIDVLHGFEQQQIIHWEDGDLVLKNLLVKDYPIIFRLTD